MNDSPAAPHYLPEGERRHETRDVAVAPLLVALIALVAMLVVIALLLSELWRTFVRQAKISEPTASPLAALRPPPPEPRLQVSPPDDLRQLRTAENDMLHRRGWVNQAEGIVQIPIEQAMEELVREGPPDWPKVPVKGEVPK